MKNLIKAFSFSALSLFAFNSANAQSSFGVKGGLNMSDFAYNEEHHIVGETTIDEVKLGFHVGAFADINLVGNYLSLQPEIHFSSKGKKVKVNNRIFSTSTEAKSTLYYLDIPVNVKASFGIGEIFRAYAMAGPYVSFGLGGKNKVTTTMGELVTIDEDKIQWGNDSGDQFRRFDTGVTVGGGVEISKMVIGASYDLGLYNINTMESYSTTKINNRVLKVSVGVKF